MQKESRGEANDSKNHSYPEEFPFEILANINEEGV
jgi:hypothetical protein